MGRALIMKEVLVTSAYPRSGQTFLNYALKHLYYEDAANTNYHTVKSLVGLNKPIISIRNPLDCIASWSNYPSGGSLIDDIKFYLRFHNAVLENKDKSVILEFEKFTVDSNYLISKIKDAFDIDPINSWDLNAIKSSMLENQKDINLPVSNYDNINRLKEELQLIPEFQDCIELYNTLKP
jgi:hypothetical protein